MSFYDDGTKLNNRIIIDGVVWPYTSKPIQVIPNLEHDSDRLAGSRTMEGKVLGVKQKITLNYALLNKEHFDLVYEIMHKYEVDNEDMFFDITVPVYKETKDKTRMETYRVYLGATSFSSMECTESTEYIYLETGDESYDYCGENYDELHENIEVVFIEK